MPRLNAKTMQIVMRMEKETGILRNISEKRKRKKVSRFTHEYEPP